jgi:hypothetical protein
MQVAPDILPYAADVVNRLDTLVATRNMEIAEKTRWTLQQASWYQVGWGGREERAGRGGRGRAREGNRVSLPPMPRYTSRSPSLFTPQMDCDRVRFLLNSYKRIRLMKVRESERERKGGGARRRRRREGDMGGRIQRAPNTRCIITALVCRASFSVLCCSARVFVPSLACVV